HWLKIVRDNDARVDWFLETMDRNPRSPTRGGIWMEGRYHDPKPTMMLMSAALAGYLNPDSRYRGDARIPEAVALALEYAARVQNDDGTFDFTPVNFRSPPDTAFIVSRMLVAYDLISVPGRQPGLTRLLNPLLAVIRRAGAGMSGLGFHTPNHRWALAAALMSCARLLNDDSYKAAAERLLVEGVDNNEDGEYSERSAGNYNVVNNEQMIVLADTRGDSTFLDCVTRNLEMMRYYVEPDGSVFTGNSTRQDRGVKTYLDQYWYHYYIVGRRRARADFLSTARRIMTGIVESGRQAPDCLDRLMLEGSPIDYGSEEIPALASYEKHFTDSRIVRLRRGQWSCSLLGNAGSFLFFQSGAIAASLRLGVTWFEQREFRAQTIEHVDGAWVLSCLMKGWYYLPFDQPPGTSDWWKMDHTKRRKTEGPDIVFTVKVRERPGGDGVDVDAEIAGWDHVPVRFEIFLTPGVLIQGDSFALEAKPGESVLVTSGVLRAQQGLDAMAIGPLFAEHRETRGVYGSEACSRELFTAYATTFTPVRRSLVFHRIPWADGLLPGPPPAR
ncbi:MAG: hypothetical protein NTU62_10595, partial [Spirochaetes bacterium]|nr:hypothetical protein [Spirochaetota bacterium]